MKNSLLNRKETRLTNQLPNIKTLVIGDSHLAAGFNTKHFGHQSYNYCGSGENYMQNYYKLKSVLDQPNNIKTVVIPYEMHSTSSFRNNRITDYSYYGKHISFLNEAISQQNPGLIQDFIKSKAFSYLGQLDNWRRWQKGIKQRDITEGIEMRSNIFTNNTNKEQIARGSATIHFKDATAPDQFATSHLRKLIALCKQKNKQPILVRMPVTDLYLKEVNKFQQLEQVEKDTETHRQQYFEEIPYFNFRDSITSLDLFDDSNHLNFEGSKQFSTMLKRQIQDLYPNQRNH